jgi:acetylornithine deacetylase/succinyl-diaminopimelate desuccinylase-like protein
MTLGRLRSDVVGRATSISTTVRSALQQQTTALLQRLIRFNTVNPPGNEREAQEWLASQLRDGGFEVDLLGAVPERPNLVARLRGRGDGATLCLLSHVDTVLATAGDWTHDPWSGDVADGCVWGRGALDMKSQTAAEVAAALSLAREGWRPARGDLLVVVLVDEEVGGELGASWICDRHPDKVRCDLLLNEGGGAVIPFDGERIYGVCIGEKGVFRFRLTTDGVAGHASIPKIGDNALLKMAPLLARMADRQPDFDLTDGARALLEGLGLAPDGDASAALERLRERDAGLALLVEPMLGVTLAPTRISASEKINVIPATAELGVDCRIPPGLDEQHALARIREVLGDDGYRLEFTERVPGNGSPVATPLMDAIERWIGEHDAGARVLPTILPGFTDSRTFRETFPECVAYGFFPQRHMSLYETAPLIHAADERIDVRDLGFAAAFFRDVCRELLGG